MIQIMYLQFLGHRVLHVNRVLCYRNCVDVNRDNLPAIMWSMVKPFMVFLWQPIFYVWRPFLYVSGRLL